MCQSVWHLKVSVTAQRKESDLLFGNILWPHFAFILIQILTDREQQGMVHAVAWSAIQAAKIMPWQIFFTWNGNILHESGAAF